MQTDLLSLCSSGLNQTLASSADRNQVSAHVLKSGSTSPVHTNSVSTTQNMIEVDGSLIKHVPALMEYLLSEGYGRSELIDANQTKLLRERYISPAAI